MSYSQEGDKYKMYKDMTGTVRLTIRNATKADKGKYTGKIFRVPKEVTETTLKVEGEFTNLFVDKTLQGVVKLE